MTCAPARSAAVRVVICSRRARSPVARVPQARWPAAGCAPTRWPTGRTAGRAPGAGQRLLIYRRPAGEPLTAASRNQPSAADQAAELCRRRGVPLALLTNGALWVLVHARPGEPVTTAIFDADLWLEERDLLRAFASLLGARRVLPPPRQADGSHSASLAALFARSAEAQAEVTDTLGTQVREAVAGLAFMVQKGSSAHPTSIASLCGLTVAAEKGSVEAVAAQQQASACTKSGKKPLKLLIYPDQNAVNLALSSNRAQVAFADSPVVSYEVKLSNGKFAQSGGVYQAGPEGIEISKGNDGMRKALQAAMNKLISSGTYQKLLANWGVQSGAITQSQLEPPANGSNG